MDSVSALQKAKKVLAADMACGEGDFDREGVFINVAREVEGRRQFPLRENVLMFATFGTGVVISCSPNRLQWVKTNLGGHTRDDIFNASVISNIEQYVSQDNQTIAGPDLKFICAHDTLQTLKPVQDVEIRVVRDEEIQALYADKRFRNAMGDAHNPKRPRVTAVTAASGGEIVGIAAASADSYEMYQVGIDIIPGYRNKGIGSTLVSILTKSILEMGKIPYYSTWANNIASRRLAITVGYRPAWVEIYTRDKGER